MAATWQQPMPCDWMTVQPWEQYGQSRTDRCGKPGLFRIEQTYYGLKGEDGELLNGQTSDHLSLCAQHLEACVFLYGPQRVKHWGEGLNVYTRRIRGETSL